MAAVKILSVDDSRTVRIIVRNAFKRFDCEVIEAGNGLEALERAREKPDLMLVDITMPVMDGLTMLRKLREDPELKDIPVVMLTAEGQKTTAEQTTALGSSGYLVKPFTADTLVQFVGKIIPLKEKAAAA